MTANYVARETGFAMRGWGHGDRTTNEAFAPLETYGERFDALLRDIRALGFDAIDLWGAHLNPEWATDEHVAVVRDALERRGLEVATYAVWVDKSNIVRSCELAQAVGTKTIGGGLSGEPAELAPVLREHSVTLAIENHPERTPSEVLAKIEAGAGTMAATVDTGWWATQGYDPARAIEELGVHVRHVHLKDVLHEGEPHETCAWGKGIVDVEACVRALQRIGYSGSLTVEHEPEHHDPSHETRAMRTQLEGWLR
ncbi:MAG: sugar phosphate isomerase/epimerase [Gaiellaceae bacterium MAG52_C11]|nr:sugar phosphate isomerase/epimerase [Candidatus Gaiellasilicea maunaloa]